MSGVSILGWLHGSSAAVALIVGALVLFGAKGTARHRRLGRIYFCAVLVASLSSLAIYDFDIARFRPFTAGPGVFGLFHWETVATLAVLLLAFYAAPRQGRAFWSYAHPAAMLFTYYMLVGALVNQLFVRVPALRSMAAAEVHGTNNIAGAPIVGALQSLAMLVFIAALTYFMTKVALYRRGWRPVAA